MSKNIEQSELQLSYNSSKALTSLSYIFYSN